MTNNMFQTLSKRSIIFLHQTSAAYPVISINITESMHLDDHSGCVVKRRIFNPKLEDWHRLYQMKVCAIGNRTSSNETTIQDDTVGLGFKMYTINSACHSNLVLQEQNFFVQHKKFPDCSHVILLHHMKKYKSAYSKRSWKK